MTSEPSLATYAFTGELGKRALITEIAGAAGLSEPASPHFLDREISQRIDDVVHRREFLPARANERD